MNSRAGVNINPPARTKGMLRSNVRFARCKIEGSARACVTREGGAIYGSGKARGRDSTSTNAGQAPEPSRNERRYFNEVVKDLPLVFLNPTVVAAQDNRMAATGCLTIESAGAVTSLNGSSFAWHLRMSIGATHSMASRHRHYWKESTCITKQRIGWCGTSGNAETKNASWFTRSAGSRSSTRGVAFYGHRGTNRNRSRSRCPEPWGKLRVRFLLIESVSTNLLAD